MIIEPQAESFEVVGVDLEFPATRCRAKNALHLQVCHEYADITGRAFVANDDWNMDEPSPSNRWEPFTDKELNTLYAWPLHADVSEIQSIDRSLIEEIAAEIAGRKEKGK